MSGIAVVGAQSGGGRGRSDGAARRPVARCGGRRDDSRRDRDDAPERGKGFGPYSVDRRDEDTRERRGRRAERRRRGHRRPQRPSGPAHGGEAPRSHREARRPATTRPSAPARRRRKRGPADVQQELGKLAGRNASRALGTLMAAADAFANDREREALRILRPLREQLPTRPSVRELTGLCQYRIGNYAAAAKELEVGPGGARPRKPQHPPGLYEDRRQPEAGGLPPLPGVPGRQKGRALVSGSDRRQAGEAVPGAAEGRELFRSIEKQMKTVNHPAGHEIVVKGENSMGFMVILDGAGDGLDGPGEVAEARTRRLVRGDVAVSTTRAAAPTSRRTPTCPWRRSRVGLQAIPQGAPGGDVPPPPGPQPAGAPGRAATR